MGAARTIANHGVVLIATAQGTGLAHLVHNPTLRPLIGTNQTAQQLGLTRTTARGLRAWQLAEKHRLALERQAEEHHRDHGQTAARNSRRTRGACSKRPHRAPSSATSRIINRE